MYYTKWIDYTESLTQDSSQTVEYPTEECAIQRAIQEEAKKLPEFRQTVFYIACRCRKCRPYC